MKYWKRITALIVALLLTVYGLPVSPAAQAVPVELEEDSFLIGSASRTRARAPRAATEADYPTERIRFVQKTEYETTTNESGETVKEIKLDENGRPIDGFDETTGILTMCLQVKPYELNTRPYPNGDYLDEGVFLFKTDLGTLVPVTRPKSALEERQQILGKAGRAALVTSSENPEIKNYLMFGKVEQIPGKFEDLMDPVSRFNSNHTALIVARDPNDHSKLDCYFQYRFIDGVTPPPDEDGYVTVMEFDFQCYAGTYPLGDPNAGQPKPAEDTAALFQGSLSLPESAEEVTSICEQLSYTLPGQTQAVPMTMQTGAAFIQLYDGWSDATYYYWNRPEVSPWRDKVLDVTGTSYTSENSEYWGESVPQAIEGESGPGLWYRNMLVTYVVNGFSMSVTNTISTPDEPITGADFITPTGDIDGYPRYVIPKKDRAVANEEAAAGGSKTAWIPDVYREGAATAPKALKYFLNTSVTSTSVSCPEDEGGLNALVEYTEWEFLLGGSTALSECNVKADPNAEDVELQIYDVDEEGALTLQTWTAKTYLIDDKTLGDADIYTRVQGKKLWKVYDQDNELRMVCPVGVVMEMLPSEISYYNQFAQSGGDESGTALAPQFHVTNHAADPESFIWFVESSTSSAGSDASAPVYLRAKYDFAGTYFNSSPLTVGLYREKDSVPSLTTLETEGSIQPVTPGSGSLAEGIFYVGTAKSDGTGGETSSDSVAKGLPIRSALQDQYGLDIRGQWNTVTLTPTVDLGKGINTVASLQAANRNTSGPFVLEQQTREVITKTEDDQEIISTELTNSYTIKYRVGANANDAVSGYYTLKAVYGSVEKEMLIYVDKPVDRLNYIETGFSVAGATCTVSNAVATEDGQGWVVPIECHVPARSDNSVAKATATGTIRVIELANQWRVPKDQVASIAAYDILPGIRTADGRSVDLNKILSSGDITVYLDTETANPGVKLEKSKGLLTFDSSIANNSEYVCRLTAEYQPSGTAPGGGEYPVDTRYVDFHITFVRSEPEVIDLVIEPTAGSTAVEAIVPESGKTTTKRIETIPYDQFNASWNWIDAAKAYVSGARLNKESGKTYDWVLVPTGDLPNGVQLTGDNNATLIVSPSAKTCDFTVEARFGIVIPGQFVGEAPDVTPLVVSSDPMMVSITRRAEKVTNIKNFTYGSGTIDVPEITAGATDTVVPPTINIINQYNETMTEYSATYSCTVRSDTKVATDEQAAQKVYVDPVTGNLTVEKGAYDCTVVVTVTATPSDKQQTKDTPEITIKRGIVRATSMTMSPTAVDYPSREVEDSSKQVDLTITGTTNYSLTEALDPTKLTWEMSKVLFKDGELYTYEADDGHPDIEVSSGKYTARGSVKLDKNGTLSFDRIYDPDLVPDVVTINVSYGGGTSFELQLKVNDLDPHPYSLYYEDISVEMPDSSQPAVPVVLQASVEDQYGLYMDETEYPVKWYIPEDAPLPQGVTVDGTVGADGEIVSGRLLIDHTVVIPAGTSGISFAVEGTTKDLENRVTRYIYVTKDASSVVVGSVMDPTIRNHEGMTIELPASKVGAGYSAYTLSAVVRDNYQVPMGGAVTWKVLSTTGGVSARFTDTSGGVLRLNYTDAARDNLGGTIVVQATSQANPSISSNPTTITVELAELKPTYAVPVIVDAGTNPEKDDDNNDLPVVPTKKYPADNIVTMGADVYDQYGQKMSDPYPARLSIVIGAGGVDKSIKLVESSVAGEGSATLNRALMTISIGAQDSVILHAALLTGEETVQPESTHTFALSKGPAYAYALVMDGLEGWRNQYTVALDHWESDYTEGYQHVPADPGTQTLSLRAEVWDQNDKWLKDESARIHPLWEFVGDHNGVEFTEGLPTDPASGKVRGETISLTIDSNAIEQTGTSPVLTKDIVLRVTTKGYEGQSDFTIEKTIHLTRDVPTAYRLYVEGVNSNGVAAPLERPTAEKGETTYSINPVVYDQYGSPIAGAAVKVDLVVGSVTRQGLVVVPVFDPEDPEPKEDEPDNRDPIAYELYQQQIIEEEEDPEAPEDPEDGEEHEAVSLRTLVGRFDRLTGEMTLYTASQELTSFQLEATYPSLGGYGHQRVEVPVKIDPSRPAAVDVASLERIYYMEEPQQKPAARAAEDDPQAPKDTTSVLRPILYDQYGQEIEYTAGMNLLVTWTLKIPDEAAESGYQDYKSELDADGLTREGAELLVQLSRNRADNSVLMTIQQAQFFEDKDLAVRCEVIDRSTGAQLFVVKDFSVMKFQNPYRPSAASQVAVAFDAGQYGKLVGPNLYTISVGEAVTDPPGVKTVIGYAFIGWTVNGETVVDASKLAVYNNTTYYAVYKDITNTKFLEGYGNQIRPNDLVTRAEFVSMVIRAVGGFDPEADYSGAFPDVPKGQWYTNSIGYAKQVGVVSGYPDGTFRPGNTITRAEAARILADAANYQANLRSKTFSDVEDTAWYAPYVRALSAAGVIDGFTDGTFRPYNKLTRAEAVKLIVMITVNAPNELEYSNIQQYAYCPFTDVRKDHWAFVYILRAAGIA